MELVNSVVLGRTYLSGVRPEGGLVWDFESCHLVDKEEECQQKISSCSETEDHVDSCTVNKEREYFKSAEPIISKAKIDTLLVCTSPVAAKSKYLDAYSILRNAAHSVARFTTSLENLELVTYKLDALERASDNATSEILTLSREEFLSMLEKCDEKNEKEEFLDKFIRIDSIHSIFPASVHYNTRRIPLPLVE